MEISNEKKQLKKILKQHFNHVYILLFVGLSFVGCGMGVLISARNSLDNVAVIVIVLIVFLVFSGMGMFFILNSSKRIFCYANSLCVYKRGKDATAAINSFRSVKTRHGWQTVSDTPWQHDTWYSIELKYYIDEEESFFKTAYMYNLTQLKHLQSLSEIQIKYLGRKAVIIEKFPQDEGLNLQKFSDLPKNIKVKAIVIQCLVYFSLLLLIGGFFVSGFLKQNWLIFVGLGAVSVSAVLKGYISYVIEKMNKKK